MTKTYIATREGEETLKNKTLNTCTINATDNTVTNIDAGNFASKTATEAGQTFVVSSTGAWEVTQASQYKSVAALPATGDEKIVYFLNTAGTNPVGLYVWNGTSYSPAAAGTSVDDATIISDSGVLKVPEGASGSTKGLQTKNFKYGVMQTAIRETASLSDEALLSEKITVTELAKKVVLTTGSETYTLGKDSDGLFYETA